MNIRRKFVLSILLIEMLVFSFVLSPINAEIPLSHIFEDPSNDATYNHLNDTEYIRTNNTNFGSVEIVSIGYEIERFEEKMIFNITTEDQPILNSSSYYSMLIEFENSTSKISIRVDYGGIGYTPNATNSTLVVTVINNLNSQSTTRSIDMKIVGNTISWQFLIEEVDIVSIYDNPNILINIVRSELEYSINGSSILSDGDYYRDEVLIESFDFIGGIQSENTAEKSLIDKIDPIATILYLGIPVLIILNPYIKKLIERITIY